MMRLLAAGALITIFAATTTAQSELDLKRHFEGQKVTVLIDMPATKDGIDINAERAEIMDFSKYAGLIKRYGAAVEEGDRLMITKLRVKEKHIEFQLGGGGYGTLGDETEPSFGDISVGKSKKEKRLEEDIKKETDATRRRQQREQLDDLRHDRQREERRLETERAAAVELGKQRIEQRRLQGGSRFNIRFDSVPMPDQLTPEAIRAALAKYVEF